jgi:hypothetical protein
MHPDPSHETAQDTPSAWQHHWKRAARNDPRMTAAHLAVVDTYAEHYYPGREALRGVGLSVDRLTYWTRLSERTVKGARADLSRWGWLGLVKAHGRGLVARYALVVPDLGTTGQVIPKECSTCTLNPVVQDSEKCSTCTLKAVERAAPAPLPLPIPHHLPTVSRQAAGIGADPAPTGPRRGRQGNPSIDKPKTATAPRAAMERAIPPAVLSSARGARSAPVLSSALAGALAAGWTPEQVRSELDGCDAGARNPVGVVVSRLRSLADNPPAPTRPASITDTQIQEALAAGRECEHGNPDIRTAANLPWCPICRRAAATG